ncbi:MAG: FmdB family zinc ribbon protein [Rudaea sp.]
MPIYEYRCASCGHELEVLQKISEPPLTVCPACQKSELVKRVSAAGFQLKGSGWYVTDFRNTGAKPSTKDAKGNGEAKAPETKTAGTETTSSTASASSATEAKPAASSTDKTGS